MVAKHLQDTTTLYNGVNIPWLGLGVFKVEEGLEVVRAVKRLFNTGTVALIRRLFTEMKLVSDKAYVKE